MKFACLAITTGLALTLTACGSQAHDMSSHAPHSTGGGMSSMPGMDDSHTASTGLAAAQDGYTLRPVGSVTNGSTTVRFRITTADGKPLMSYQDDQTKKLHFYLINNQAWRFQHVHAVLGTDGIWTATTTPITGGSYRMYAAFIPGSGPAKGQDLVLSAPFTVPGPSTGDGQVPPTAVASVAGYEVTVSGSGTTGTGMLRVTVTKDGKPATDLQTYLDTFAHLTAIREGDLAFAHMHPLSNTNGVLTFHTEFPGAGAWRLFLQFQSGGVLHTAQLAVTVN